MTERYNRRVITNELLWLSDKDYYDWVYTAGSNGIFGLGGFGQSFYGG